MNARQPLPKGPIGVFYDMPAEEYHAVEAFSASGMRELARSAWHYKNRLPVEPTRAMLNGTLAHCAVLEPGALSARYIVTPDDAPKKPTKAQWAAAKPSPASVAAMEWWTGFQKTAGTREIVAADDYAITQMQIKALQDVPEIAVLLREAKTEVSVFWVDPDTGVYCKARPDLVQKTGAARVRLGDLKAVADDTPEGFARAVARFGHHRQQVHYKRGVELAMDVVVEDFVFVAVSAAPPVLAVPYRLVQEVIDQGEEEVSELTAFYADCIRNNSWPAYTPGERMIDLPKWAKRSNELEVSFEHA